MINLVKWDDFNIDSLAKVWATVIIDDIDALEIPIETCERILDAVTDKVVAYYVLKRIQSGEIV